MIKIYNNATDQTLLGTIATPIHATHTEGLNAELYLDFDIPLDNDDLGVDEETPIWKLLKTPGEMAESEDPPRVLEAAGQLFDITKRKKHRSPEGGLTVEVEAEHVSYRLHAKNYEDSTFEGQTAAQMLTEVCAGTDLTAGTAPENGTKNFRFRNKTARYALIRVADAWGYDIEYDGMTVNLVAHRGKTQGNGATLQSGENIMIEDYADDSRMDGGGIKVALNIAELKELPEFGASYEVEIGDVVRVIDTELEIDSYLRVLKYVYNLIHPMMSTVELATRADRIENVFERQEETRDDLDDKIDNLKHNDLDEIQGDGPPHNHLTDEQKSKVDTALQEAPDHNDLNGLQGGTATQRNHLTNDQVTKVDGAVQDIPNHNDLPGIDGPGTNHPAAPTDENRILASTSGDSMEWRQLVSQDLAYPSHLAEPHGKVLVAWDPGSPDSPYVGWGDHNNIKGLQGGSSGQRYHLTEAEREKAQNALTERPTAEDPGTDKQDMDYDSGTVETNQTDTWSAGGTNGLYLTVVSRVVYNEAGTQIVKMKLRGIVIDKYGQVFGVGTEHNVDVADTVVQDVED